MKTVKSLLIVLCVSALVGCDSLAGTNYDGETHISLQVSVSVENTNHPDDLVPSLAYIRPAKSGGGRFVGLEFVDAQTSDSSDFPNLFTLDIHQLPPVDSAYFIEELDAYVATAYITAVTPNRPLDIGVAGAATSESCVSSGPLECDDPQTVIRINEFKYKGCGLPEGKECFKIFSLKSKDKSVYSKVWAYDEPIDDQQGSQDNIDSASEQTDDLNSGIKPSKINAMLYGDCLLVEQYEGKPEGREPAGIDCSQAPLCTEEKTKCTADGCQTKVRVCLEPPAFRWQGYVGPSASWHQDFVDPLPWIPGTLNDQVIPELSNNSILMFESEKKPKQVNEKVDGVVSDYFVLFVSNDVPALPLELIDADSAALGTLFSKPLSAGFHLVKVREYTKKEKKQLEQHVEEVQAEREACYSDLRERAFQNYNRDNRTDYQLMKDVAAQDGLQVAARIAEIENSLAEDCNAIWPVPTPTVKLQIVNDPSEEVMTLRIASHKALEDSFSLLAGL